MARPRKGTRGITVDGQVFRWRVVPPIANSDCPLCASWHVLVLTDAGDLVAEYEIPLDPATGLPAVVAPGAVAAALRSIAAARARRDPESSPPAHRHARTAPRSRHRARTRGV
jgi:hypothetical protein